MMEQWRKNMDKGKLCAALLTDPSKAFDCILHDFLTDKLEAYGFSYEALKSYAQLPYSKEVKKE